MPAGGAVGLKGNQERTPRLLVGQVDVGEHVFQAGLYASQAFARLGSHGLSRHANHIAHTLAVFRAALGVEMQRQVAGEARPQAVEPFEEELARHGPFRDAPWTRRKRAPRRRRAPAATCGRAADARRRKNAALRAVKNGGDALALRVAFRRIEHVHGAPQVLTHIGRSGRSKTGRCTAWSTPRRDCFSGERNSSQARPPSSIGA